MKYSCPQSKAVKMGNIYEDRFKKDVWSADHIKGVEYRGDCPIDNNKQCWIDEWISFKSFPES